MLHLIIGGLIVTIVGGVIVTIINRKVNRYYDRVEAMERKKAEEESAETGKPIESKSSVI